MVSHAYDSRTWDACAGGSQIEAQLRQPSNLVRPYLKNVFKKGLGTSK